MDPRWSTERADHHCETPSFLENGCSHFYGWAYWSTGDGRPILVANGVAASTLFGLIWVASFINSDTSAVECQRTGCLGSVFIITALPYSGRAAVGSQVGFLLILVFPL